jgi:hypothetical protein
MLEDNNKWNVNEKPSALACPHGFCFLWDYSKSQCGKTFGLCIREDASHSQKDWYEPNEPELEKAGLPWFYFIPNKEKLVEDLKEEYEVESRKLWKPLD